jgi:hypothetical protein
VFLVTSLLCGTTSAQQSLPDSPLPKIASTHPKTLPESPWPRTFTSGINTFTIYQPQVDKWVGNVVDLYCAVEVKAGREAAANYGVVWLEARTEVDKINRLVTFDQAKMTSVKFPVAPEKESELTSLLEKRLPGVTRTISLDRLEAALEADSEAVKGVEVKNDPPEVIIAKKPSLLVLIDGMPQMGDVPGTKLQSVLNTRSIILYDREKELYFFRVQDWWLQAKELKGPWEHAKNLSEDMKRARDLIGQSEPQRHADELTKAQPSLKGAEKKREFTEIPVVHIAFGPTELIETSGEPEYERIAGTGLECVRNTNGNIFRLGGEHYILVSGRWFKGTALDGPWTFVTAADTPPDFARIPTNDRKAAVLASVPGTPEAREALIANAIPQTATITPSQAKLTVQYDGEPTFVPIEGTSMSYAKNTSAAVIKVSAEYYSVEAGVWFKAPSPRGPWLVAATVPAQIYDIPPSSPLYYVTYVKVYGSGPDVVYVGFTPGYYGTVVSASTMTVVYGTGWYYPPYVSTTAWYGWPYTYGVGAGFTYSEDTGWSFGFGYGYGYYYPWNYPWWGPIGYYGCCWYPYYGWGAWGGAAVANVYGVWGNTAYSRTGAAWANPYTGNYGGASRGAYHNTQTGRTTVAGRGYNTNIYTGNSYGYRGGATYNPSTGIVAGGGAGFVGNIYTGQGSAGRGGFIYNTNTNAGIAAGKNNIYAGKDGTVYRYNREGGNWSSNNGNGWKPVEKPEPKLQSQQQLRNKGSQRTQNFNSMRGFGGARVGGGGRRR